jgi:hypothetical protein
MQTQMTRRIVLCAALLANTIAVRPAYCQLRLWKGSFTYDGQVYEHTMVGTNPNQAGSQVTTVPVTIMPLVLTFPDNHNPSDPTIVVVTDDTPPVVRLLRSPLFAGVVFPGHPELGTTQYIDAYQRANFWNRIDSTHDFHVFLSAVGVSPRSLTVTPTSTCPTQDSKGNWQIDWAVLDPQLRVILKAYANPSQLTLFLLDDVKICNYHNGGSTAGANGYHSKGETLHDAGPPFNTDATYVVARYHRGTTDVSTVSHELGEWLANPYGVSKAPCWMDGGTAKTALEVGDPLDRQTFEVTLNGFTYHLQDLAFLSWFKREPRWSTANGWSFHGYETEPPVACPQISEGVPVINTGQ